MKDVKRQLATRLQDTSGLEKIKIVVFSFGKIIEEDLGESRVSLL